MSFLWAIVDFIWIVLSSWQGYVTGGILVALCSIWERWHKRTIPWSKYKWGVLIFLFISFFTAWYEQREKAIKLESDRHNLNISSPAFQNGKGILRAFMSYRRSIGPEASCRILITAPADSANIASTVASLAVLGSNCPNGDLQNIGVKPWEVEKVSQNGIVPGKIVLHALPNTKGADRLVDDLSNLIQTTRSYEIPRPVDISDNIIWLQFGSGTKWNTQLH
ncbi:hypothetical protein DSCA_53250 [Desulfosarcina alkanivorans]|uniref:Uncharacterized protein n=1 Tax=Desulfosarcina alkanivorans TaxID=571177 RepID=A0A5K7YSM4_9BACT|nr:hypothetical protein [Desulfosarcina alkanivorans]BBO71395.1 hypothetical protein DSCA_53250 [Desulfosarcina alkanivorans]